MENDWQFSNHLCQTSSKSTQVTNMKHEKNSMLADRGINEESLARHFSQTSTVTCLSYCICRNSHWLETFKGRLIKFLDGFFFFEESPTLLGQSEKIVTAVNIDFNQSDYSV